MLEQISEWLRLVETGVLSERDFYQMVKQAKPAPRPQAAEPTQEQCAELAAEHIERAAFDEEPTYCDEELHAYTLAVLRKWGSIPAAPQPDRAEYWKDAHRITKESLQAACADLSTLQRERDALKAEVERLRKDAERLDWLESQQEAYGFQDIHEGNRWNVEGPFATLRKLIDAALQPDRAAELEDAYERGKKDGWEACESCHGIVDGVHQRANALQAEVERLRKALKEGRGTLSEYMRTYNAYWVRGMEILEPIGDESIAIIDAALVAKRGE